MEQVEASGSWRGATFHDSLLRSMGGGAACSRSLFKAVSWRITGSIDSFVIGFFNTGRLTIAGSIAAVEMFTKIALYYGARKTVGGSSLAAALRLLVGAAIVLSKCFAR